MSYNTNKKAGGALDEYSNEGEEVYPQYGRHGDIWS